MTAAMLVLAVAELAWAVAVAWGASDGGIGMMEGVAYLVGGGAFGLATALAACVAVVDALTRRDRWVMRDAHRLLLAQCALLAAAFVAVSHGMALRVRLVASWPAFAAVVAGTPPGTRSREPIRVGLFDVREVDAPGASVRLITAECGLDDCGLAYARGGPPPVVGEDSYTPLGGGWYHWHRSW